MTRPLSQEPPRGTILATPWVTWWRTHGPTLGAVLVAITVAAAVGGLLILAGVHEYHRAPERNVPAWRHVTDAELAKWILFTQVQVAVFVLLGVAAAVERAVRGYFDRAVAVFLVVVVFTLAEVTVMPGVTVGSRSVTPIPSNPEIHATMDPVPISTDLDYHAYMPHLVHAVTGTALWSLAAAVPLGLALAAAGPVRIKLRGFTTRRKRQAQRQPGAGAPW